MIDNNRPLYTISVAAKLSGLHPQTLREYERRGLLDPARSRGGTRRYSDRDLTTLRHIGELTAVGINLEGVRRILQLEAQLRDQDPGLATRARGQSASGSATNKVTTRRQHAQ